MTIPQFRFKQFQLADYASAAMHDGVILGHDTGGGKGLALYVWPCLKVGFNRGVKALQPKGAVLLVAPGDLHKQVMDEGRDKFQAATTLLDSQETFLRLSRVNPKSGRRELPAGFYLTSYTQLGTNGVAEFPKLTEGVECLMTALNLTAKDIEAFHADRGIHFERDYQRLAEYSPCGPDSSPEELRNAWQNARQMAPHIAQEFDDAYEIVRHFAVDGSGFAKLPAASLAFVQRMAIAWHHREYAMNIGQRPTDPRAAKLKCVYSPTLADLCQDTFDCVAVDEGVKMKGEDTLIGQGVRQMTPRYRLVLTATPIKNRLPDIFRLAWWAAGGTAEANARWPYPDEAAARDEFAEEFLISERNISKEEESKRRFKKLTPQVCNVHRLWKLLAPNVLRRRKREFGEDIVAKHRHIVRVPMGSEQARVYQYHLLGTYKDSKGKSAIGPQLQALRIAAANPASALLTSHPSRQNAGMPCRGLAYIPKLHAALKIIHQVLARGEQVVVFSAFHDSLDALSARLNQAGVNHLVADGRMSQKKRGEAIKQFKQGGPRAVREGLAPQASEYPVLLAGVESVAEGHSMHLCNNVVLMCYSWAYDKFEQAINRAHRLNSPWDVNVYPIICDGSIDRKLEALIQEKGDAAELVLDGHLLGEHTSEVNLAELLNIARQEFTTDNTVDEAALELQWPALRAELAQLAAEWARPVGTVSAQNETISPKLVHPVPESEAMIPRHESNRTPTPVTRNTRGGHNLSMSPATPMATSRHPAPAWRRRTRAIVPQMHIGEMPLWRSLVR